MVAIDREVFILGANADIGEALLHGFASEGWRIGGTYRQAAPDFSGLHPAVEPVLVRCDFADDGAAQTVATHFAATGRCWDVIISAVGTMLPIGPFMDTPFSAWERNVRVNMLSQLETVHALYPYRRRGSKCHVVFLAGGGTNGPFPNYSAYCLSKIALIKACELIDDECEDVNAFIVGPGWVRTKIHGETMASGMLAGENLGATERFVAAGDPGTPLEAIYRCIRWGIDEGRSVVGGRNFSVVHDPWGKPHFKEQLLADPNLCKLRRKHPSYRGTLLDTE